MCGARGGGAWHDSPGTGCGCEQGLVAHLTPCSRTGACLRSDAVSDGWMTDVMLCLISQSEG